MNISQNNTQKIICKHNANRTCYNNVCAVCFVKVSDFYFQITEHPPYVDTPSLNMFERYPRTDFVCVDNDIRPHKICGRS